MVFTSEALVFLAFTADLAFATGFDAPDFAAAGVASRHRTLNPTATDLPGRLIAL